MLTLPLAIKSRLIFRHAGVAGEPSTRVMIRRPTRSFPQVSEQCFKTKPETKEKTAKKQQISSKNMSDPSWNLSAGEMHQSRGRDIVVLAS